MNKKLRLLDRLKEYLDNASKEELEKDWKELESYNNIGPDVKEYIEYIRKLHKNV